MPASSTENHLLQEGTSLGGQLADYKISGPLGGGGDSQTYIATIEKVQSEGTLTPGSKVVVKLPKQATIADDLNDHTALLKEIYALKQLRGVSTVAQVLDHGLHDFDDLPLIFIVEQFINGSNLDDFMKATHANEAGEFMGIPLADDCFNWARQLTEAVIAIHQRQITHCDIKPANVRVNEDGRIVLIDLGRAGFRAHQVASSKISRGGPPHIAPEGSGTVEGDIYALGALMFYLATGDKEPVKDEDIDKLKEKVKDTIVKVNSKLYEGNYGIVDIVARCLRYSDNDRSRHGQVVLQDLETFSKTTWEDCDSREFRQDFSFLMDSGKPLFLEMAKRRLDLLHRAIVDMGKGVHDMFGDHEDIVSGMTSLMSSLGPGDEYLTISIPLFWTQRNMGVDGRFLSMNKVAATRGATIRRVFLITEKDRHEIPEFDSIMNAQRDAANELQNRGYYASDWELEKKRYYVGAHTEVTSKQREHLVRTGKHVGLIYKGDEGVLVAAVYREDGTIVALQVRSEKALLDGVKKVILAHLEKSTELRKFLSKSKKHVHGGDA